MNKLYGLLRILLWGLVVGFSGNGIRLVYDYMTRPERYAVQSAPWYLGLVITGALTVLLAAVLLILMGIVKKRIRSSP